MPILIPFTKKVSTVGVSEFKIELSHICLEPNEYFSTIPKLRCYFVIVA